MDVQPIVDKIKELFPKTGVSVKYRQKHDKSMVTIERDIRDRTKSSDVDIRGFPKFIFLSNPRKAPEKIEIRPYLPVAISASISGLEEFYLSIDLEDMKYKSNGSGLQSFGELENFLIDSGYKPKRS